MDATVMMERQTAEQDAQQSIWTVFRGRNLLRFIISGWPKITQQFVGLSVFNTYATYFCKFSTPYGVLANVLVKANPISA